MIIFTDLKTRGGEEDGKSSNKLRIWRFSVDT